MDHFVWVISGLTLSGKSWLIERLQGILRMDKVTVVRMDDVRVRYWGERKLTSAEGFYRNELVRNEVKTHLIVNGAEAVLVEIPMLTRQVHQKPFVDMVRDAERYIQEIERERAEKAGGEVLSPSKVILRVVLLYCHPSVALERILIRKNAPNDSNTVVFDENRYYSIAPRFELPGEDTYVPLPIDTSDPSTKPIIISETANFLVNGIKPVNESIRVRLETAQRYLDEAREKAARRRTTRPLV